MSAKFLDGKGRCSTMTYYNDEAGRHIKRFTTGRDRA